MRDLALASVLMLLLAMAAARPFVGVLVWSWISFMNPHREVWGFAQTMPWAMLAFVATVFGCFVAREPKRPAVNAVTVLLALFAVCITVTSVLALGPPEMVWSKWDRTIKMLAGLLLTASLLTDRWRVHALIWLIVISLGFYGVKGGLFTLVTGGGHIVLGPPESMIGDRNHLSTGLLFSLPLMNYLRQHSRHNIVQLGLVAAMGLTLFSVVGSQSRGALVGLAATGAMLWLRSSGKIVSGVAIGASVLVAITFMPDSWVERMNSMRNFQADDSAMGRVTIWSAAFKLALMRPLVGAGFRGMYVQSIVDRVDPSVIARATHSIWFEALGEHGFPAFLVWLGAMAAGAWYSWRICSLTRHAPGLRWAYDLARMSQVSIVAFCTGGTFLSLAYWDGFWTLMAVIGGVHTMALEQVRSTGAQVATARPAGWRLRPADRLGAIQRASRL
jgi:probable O-glycosylation ligase (exosortase A-associated)